MTQNIGQLTGTMRAMVLEQAGRPLSLKNIPAPVPAGGQLLAKVMACGVCRTDLHIVDGELKAPALPLIPGHEIIAKVESCEVGTLFKPGDLIGIPWLAYTCGTCSFCKNEHENLCEKALFTGYSINGGFAEYVAADARYCYHIPSPYANASGAPLLCAGLIGYRSYKMAGDNISKLGIYGFGAAAHIIVQVAVAGGKKVFAFTREGDNETKRFAMSLGASWCGGAGELSPEKLDAAIIYAPAGELVPQALKAVDKGGVVVCAGIHMSDIPSFPYRLLWEERSLRSVANLTRKDAQDFLAMLAHTSIRTTTTLFPLEKANEALEQLRDGKIQGAAVLVPGIKA